METLAVSARLYGPLVETLQKGAVEASEPDLQARLWGMTARLIEEHLGDAKQAIEAWRAALAARPDDLDSFLALERLLTAAARMPELVEVLEKHLEIATDPADRKLIAKRIAVLYDQSLKEPERAIARGRTCSASTTAMSRRSTRWRRSTRRARRGASWRRSSSGRSRSPRAWATGGSCACRRRTSTTRSWANRTRP